MTDDDSRVILSVVVHADTALCPFSNTALCYIYDVIPKHEPGQGASTETASPYKNNRERPAAPLMSQQTPRMIRDMHTCSAKLYCFARCAVCK